MLSIRENLGTKEAAEVYNCRLLEGWGKWGGCIGARACVYCYHVISDSTCLCSGSFKCPKCDAQNGTDWSAVKVSPAASFTGWARWNVDTISQLDYSI